MDAKSIGRERWALATHRGLVLASWLSIAPGFSAPCAAREGPTYASEASRRVITRMVAAHGGLERWRRASATHFKSSLEVHFGGDRWVSYAEEVTVEISTRRVYATLPNPDGTHGLIAYDGRQAWSAGNLQGIARAPARFTAWRNFYLFNLPWLTQDSGVHLGEPQTATLPIDGKPYTCVAMSFDPGVGDTPKDTYRLFIDPKTSRLRAAEYVMTYAAMTNGAPASPPSIFVWERTEEVDGLMVPTRYTVYWSKDGSVAVRGGTIRDWDFGARFDEARLEMPSDGKPDQSQP